MYEKWSRRMRNVIAVVVSAVTVWGSGAARGDGFSYLEFAAPTRLVFQADALPTNDVCRLTPSVRSRVGGVWFENRQLVRDGFETTFQFQISKPGQYGADGFAFVIQRNPTPSLGRPGWQLGFGGISNSLIVKFDNYHWRDKIYQRYDEIAVSACGESGDCDPDTNAVASVTRDMLFSDGKIHTARIRYQSGEVRVYLDDFRDSILRTAVALPPAFDASTSKAWVGFTAATGADVQTHDILSWTFFSGLTGPIAPTTDTPITGTDTQLEKLKVVQASPEAITGGAVGSAAASAARAPVGARGPVLLALPLGTTLPWRIEASTNLVNWEAVTNVTFHFSDSDSTQFNHRFYRIFER